jgi:hypothetical protein
VRLTPMARTRGEAMVAGVIFVLLLACCGALLEGGPGKGQWCFAGLCLVGAGLAYSRFASGAWPGIDMLLERVDRWVRRHEETPSQRNARNWRCSEAVAKKLQDLEQQVNTLVELGVGRRLEELERQERWRMQTEYSELRDVWRTLLGDGDTPEEVRQACREWLARYPRDIGLFGAAPDADGAAAGEGITGELGGARDPERSHPVAAGWIKRPKLGLTSPLGC